MSRREPSCPTTRYSESALGTTAFVASQSNRPLAEELPQYVTRRRRHRAGVDKEIVDGHTKRSADPLVQRVRGDAGPRADAREPDVELLGADTGEGRDLAVP